MKAPNQGVQSLAAVALILGIGLPGLAQGRRSLGCFSRSTGQPVSCTNPARPPAPPPPPQPSEDELRRAADEKDLRDATDDAWDKGVGAYRSGDFDNAVRWFQQALKYDRDRPGFQGDDPDLLQNLQAAQMMLEKNKLPRPTPTPAPTPPPPTPAPPPPPTPTPPPPKPSVVQIGAAAAVRGTVYWVADDGTKVPITNGKPIFFNKRIVVEDGGHLQVMLLDETVFTLGPHSDMVLDEFVYDPDTRIGKMAASLVKGTFRFVTGKMAHKDTDQMKIKLPAVAVGIRGTDFEVLYQPGTAGYIKLFRGELLITPKHRGEFPMKAGQMVAIGADDSISQPRWLYTRAPRKTSGSGTK